MDGDVSAGGFEEGTEDSGGDETTAADGDHEVRFWGWCVGWLAVVIAIEREGGHELVAAHPGRHTEFFPDFIGGLLTQDMDIIVSLPVAICEVP